MEYILITGAYGGMGRAAVQALRARGYGIFALDRKVEPSDDAGVIPIRADLTDAASIASAVAAVRAVTDRLFAIVHFAGIYMLDSLIEIKPARFEESFRINLGGAFTVNRLFFPLLGRGSRILITTSELAPLDPLPFTGLYGVTKCALDRYAFALGMELQLLGISVSVLRAGAVSTGMLGASTDALTAFCEKTALYRCNAARFRRIVDSVEAKSVPPERIAKKVLHILGAKRPAFAYAINRNPLLRLLNLLPKRMQLWAIRLVLREKADKHG